MQNDNQWVWLVQVSEYALLLFLLLLLFSSHRLYLTKLLSKEANFFCSVSNSVTTSNNAYNHTYTKPQVRSMTTRQSIIIIIIMMIIVIIIFTMQKICYTYVKPRMYNKVILVVYIPYVVLMFTCGV